MEQLVWSRQIVQKYPQTSLVIASMAIATAIPTLSHTHAVIAQHITPKSALAKDQSREKERVEILFVNRSGVGLKSLQMAPAQSRAWEPNILSTDMTDGEERQVKVTNQRRDCYRNIKAVFANGSSIEDYNINFCRNDIYTFTTTTLSVPALW